MPVNSEAHKLIDRLDGRICNPLWEAVSGRTSLTNSEAESLATDAADLLLASIGHREFLNRHSAVKSADWVSPYRKYLTPNETA